MPTAATSAQLVASFLAQAGGDPLQAVAAAKTAREQDPGNIALRNAEHQLFSHYVVRQLGPVLGRAVVLAAVPAYSAAKAIGRPIGLFRGATPPSVQEITSGLLPVVQPLPVAVPVIVSYITVGAWPGAQVSSLSDCAAYLATHGGTGCRGVYADGTLGPLIPADQLVPVAAPPPPPAGLGADARGGYYALSFHDVEDARRAAAASARRPDAMLDGGAYAVRDMMPGLAMLRAVFPLGSYTVPPRRDLRRPEFVPAARARAPGLGQEFAAERSSEQKASAAAAAATSSGYDVSADLQVVSDLASVFFGGGGVYAPTRAAASKEAASELATLGGVLQASGLKFAQTGTAVDALRGLQTVFGARNPVRSYLRVTPQLYALLRDADPAMRLPASNGQPTPDLQWANLSGPSFLALLKYFQSNPAAVDAVIVGSGDVAYLPQAQAEALAAQVAAQARAYIRTILGMLSAGPSSADPASIARGVQAAYQQLLGRAPTSSELALTVRQLATGAMTAEQFMSGLLSSSEYRARASGGPPISGAGVLGSFASSWWPWLIAGGLAAAWMLARPQLPRQRVVVVSDRHNPRRRRPRRDRR